MVKFIYVDFATGRAFFGIDNAANFSLTCKAATITGFGQKVMVDKDERLEPGNISASVYIN